MMERAASGVAWRCVRGSVTDLLAFPSVTISAVCLRLCIDDDDVFLLTFVATAVAPRRR